MVATSSPDCSPIWPRTVCARVEERKVFRHCLSKTLLHSSLINAMPALQFTLSSYFLHNVVSLSPMRSVFCSCPGILWFLIFCAWLHFYIWNHYKIIDTLSLQQKRQPRLVTSLVVGAEHMGACLIRALALFMKVSSPELIIPYSCSFKQLHISEWGSERRFTCFKILCMNVYLYLHVWSVCLVPIEARE